MRQKLLRDQRGVAMLLELVLVAAVLALAGLAVYQANHRASDSSAVSTAPASSKTGLAESAAKIGTADLANDAAVSADALAGEVTDSNEDVSSLGGSSNVAF